MVDKSLDCIEQNISISPFFLYKKFMLNVYGLAAKTGIWLILILSVALIWSNTPTNAGTLTWAKSYYFTNPDLNQWSNIVANSILQTDDGGYIVAGTAFASNSCIWVSKLDDNGEISWLKGYDMSSYGGGIYVLNDKLNCIKKTADGGYILAGRIKIDGDNWSDDMFVLKLNSNGEVDWQKVYGTSCSYDECNEEATSILQTIDGGYIVAGNTNADSLGLDSVLLFKLNVDGSIAWQKVYGYDNESALAIHSLSRAHQIVETSDGGYILLAENSGAALLKLDSGGNIEWQKSYNVKEQGDNFNELNSRALRMVPTGDGNYLLAGRTVYRDYYDNGNEKPQRSVMWFMLVDGGGNLIWVKGYVDPISHDGYTPISLRKTADGEYIVVGNRSTPYLTEYSPYDIFVIKLSDNGTIRWEKIYAGYAGALNNNYDDEARAIQQTSDGGYILAGLTYNFSPRWGDNSAAWILKLDSRGEIPDCSAESYLDYLQPTTYNLNVTVNDLEVTSVETNISARDNSTSPFNLDVNEMTQCASVSAQLNANFSVVSPLAYTFTCSASGGSGNYTYYWDFNGDGIYDNTTTDNSTTYTYNSYGIYYATVKVVDSDNNTAISSPLEIKVKPENGDVGSVNVSIDNTTVFSVTGIVDNASVDNMSSTLSINCTSDNCSSLVNQGISFKYGINIGLTLSSGVTSTRITLKNVPLFPGVENIFFKNVNGNFIDLTDNQACGSCNFTRTDNLTTHTTTISFTIEDGGVLDADGTVNGKIQDPVVVGTKQASSPLQTQTSSGGGGGGGGCTVSDSPSVGLLLILLTMVGFAVRRKFGE